MIDVKFTKTYDRQADDLLTQEPKTPLREPDIHQLSDEGKNYTNRRKQPPQNCTEWIINISPDDSVLVNEAELPSSSGSVRVHTEKTKLNVIDINRAKKQKQRKSPASKTRSSKRKKSLWRKILILFRKFVRKLR